jgi:tetratricopeptide (TPR) repeat protein
MVRTICAWILMLGFCAGLSMGQESTVGSVSMETFQQYLEQLQQKPGDRQLREKVIQYAQQMKLGPEISKEARAHFSKGYFVQREAKSKKDYETAVAEYQKAIDLAPWWAAVYYHLGTAYERLGNRDAAIENLNLFLASHPGHAGEQEALDRIHNLEKKTPQRK